jgi:hypothetical protein
MMRVVIVFVTLSIARIAAADVPIDFNRQVRPILSDYCFACHGPDAEQRQGDLRLDERAAALEDRGGYRAIVPGEPHQSEILRRISADDDDQRMPPADTGRQLTDAQREILTKWIEQGAEYQQHWAFEPLRVVPPPPVDPPDAAHNAIDHFVLKRLEQAELQPSPEADRGTLIRRLYLDVLGILPTPEEVRRFEEDDRRDAYEQLVDEVLRNPHYGERWGRHWLDQARYADSNGYTIDGERVMWPYRDWVIKALNDDMPFDQFTIEQLAGDLLPSPTKWQRIATGFHRNTLINQEGGTDPEQFRIEAVMDRVATTGAVWLGLTVGCAQCHSHKFDPISQREYYQLYAYFNHGVDVNNVGPTEEVHEGEIFLSAGAKEGQKELSEAIEAAEQLAGERSQRQQAWEHEFLGSAERKRSPREADWIALKVREVQGESATFQTLDDGSVLASQGVPRENYVVQTEALPGGTRIGSIQLRVIPHDSLPQRGPGLAGNGNFVLTAVEVYLGDERLKLSAATASHAQPGYPVSTLIDDDPATGWAINVAAGSSAKMNAEHIAWLACETPVTTDGRALRFILRHELNNDYNVGRFQLSVSSETVDSTGDSSLLDALRTASEKRTREQQETLRRAFASVDRPYLEALERVANVRRSLGLGPSVKTMIMQEQRERRPTYLLTRGDFLRPDREAGEIEPETLAVLPRAEVDSSQRPANRLDLARWLVHIDNPLTPRVTVNRIWMRYFGRGLVETENDFGTQGSPPTHPELLDWLADYFMRQGWSQKAVHRLIVTSATYRQASHYREDIAVVDPANVLLGRQNRLRLDAEIIRDAVLCASGKMVETIGGPSVHPPQPEGVYAFTQNRKTWKTASGPDRYRRAMYTMFYRSAPYPMLTTFDAPDFQSVCTRRVRSNTPLQALTMANDEAITELSKWLAIRLMSNAVTDQERVDYGFRIAYARSPSAHEEQLLLSYLSERRAYYADETEAAEVLSRAVKSPDNAPVECAAWISVARVLMNTDEFITRE